jgi:deoxyribodipyrimidine photolyase-related protein
MEFFYREMRKRYTILMDGDKPEGGQWNFDAQNRKSPPKGATIPPTYASKPDAITQEVIQIVESNFPNHFGDIGPFHFAVTRTDALEALELFIDERLPCFGDYQDGMLEDEP